MEYGLLETPLLPGGFLGKVLSLASRAVTPDNPRKAYVTTGDDPLARHAPIFVLQTFADTCNRIGTPRATRASGGGERIFVDPAQPTIYAERQEFETERGRYTNLIYRVHFERVPWFHLTVGRNVGIFVILTLDAEQRPVLLTTAHTCGCYLAFIPTTFLPAQACPAAWSTTTRDVYGEALPGLLRYESFFNPDVRPVIFLRDGTHRVMDVRLENANEAATRYDVIRTPVAPMAALKSLPLDGATTSFYHGSGRRKGYVKGSKKPLEMIFLGPIAFDFWVGRDKELGPRDETGVVIYTSLKFWRRDDSSLWTFARLLNYNGWRL